MNFKKSFKLSSLALATSLAMGAVAVPTAANAEMSASLAINSMYLWRGQDISGGPTVSGSIDYDFGNGFSVGTWASTESSAGNMEVDLYGSYAGSVGDFGYSIGYASYQYPEAREDDGTKIDLGDSDISEYIVGLSYGDFSFTAFIDTEGSDADNYKYYSLDYAMGKWGLHYGISTQDTSEAEYNDVNISYAVTDNLTWTISKASGDATDPADGIEDSPLVVLSYSVPLK